MRKQIRSSNLRVQCYGYECRINIVNNGLQSDQYERTKARGREQSVCLCEKQVANLTKNEKISTEAIQNYQKWQGVASL